jgi:hypothetical protein
MKFELGIGIGKNHGIYELWEWLGVGKIPRKMKFMNFENESGIGKTLWK